MAYALTPRRKVRDELTRVAHERLDHACSLLDELHGASTEEIERAVHEVRKHCKEVRGLAELIRPALGSGFGSFDGLVRDAARELSSIRDAHAVLDTFDRLRAAQPALDHPSLDRARAHQADVAAAATRSVADGDQRLEHARFLLRAASVEIEEWEIPSGFGPLAAGLRRTYARGAKRHAKVQRRASDERIHEWRKETKRLWYQLRLLQQSAPSVLDPTIELLHALGDALGDDHDLAVLVDLLEDDPASFGGHDVVERASALARAQQDLLRSGATRLGATIYAESAKAFAKRINRYWDATIDGGPELDVGGIEELGATTSGDGDVPAPAPPGGGSATAEPPSTIERERKWLVRNPPILHDGATLRQGYLAIDGPVSVRVRDAGNGDRTLTIKAGRGISRTELEWPIDSDVFDAAWSATQGRRIVKTRYRLPLRAHTVELDVFDGQLDGLVVAEVEFDSDEALAAFAPPAWFGREVSDDVRYTNASMAVHGLDPSLFT
jgi:CYTH domain-containing protein/CHAD domain-containing protein